MKSQKISLVAAVVGMTLLACSLSFAQDEKKIEGPIVGHQVNPIRTIALRDMVPARLDLTPHIFSNISAATTITPEFSVAGQPFTKGQLYSDATGAVGATQYVQLVNEEYTVYNKSTGAVIVGPIASKTIWADSNDVCATSVGSDGTVIYDQIADVWVFLIHATPTGGPYLDCMAISLTSDATGAYNIYDYELTEAFPDKPKVGLWADGYYISQDILNPSTKDFMRSQACAVYRDAMLAGQGSNSVCFQGSISLPTFVVTTLDGQTLPNAGEPEFFWQLDQRPYNGRNNLNSFQFSVNWSDTSASTFTGPVANVLPSYTDTCDNLKPCVPQPGTTTVVQGWGDRLMHQITYRNFGTYESVLMTHSVTEGTGTAAHGAVRWYEWRTPLTPVIYQSGTYSPDKTTYRWVPSIRQDQFGDMAVGYNVSSSTVYPGIRYAVRIPTDTLGALEPEQTLVTGAGSQDSTNQNWSSFTNMYVDPVDDCTFFYTAQYYATSSLSGWLTNITSFRLPSCTN
jgi:hypothetical protein